VGIVRTSASAEASRSANRALSARARCHALRASSQARARYLGQRPKARNSSGTIPKSKWRTDGLERTREKSSFRVLGDQLDDVHVVRDAAGDPLRGSRCLPTAPGDVVERLPQDPPCRGGSSGPGSGRHSPVRGISSISSRSYPAHSSWVSMSGQPRSTAGPAPALGAQLVAPPPRRRAQAGWPAARR